MQAIKSELLELLRRNDYLRAALSIAEIKDIFNSYVAAKNLVNAQVQQYINVGEDEILAQAVYVKNEENPEFMKREDALRRIRNNMQVWHEIKTEGGDPIAK